MREIVERTTRSNFAGQQERLLGTLEEMYTVEKFGLCGRPSAIFQLFDYYKALPKRGDLPLADDFELWRLRHISEAPLSAISMIDVTAQDEMNWVFHGHRGLCGVAVFPPFAGMRIGDHPLLHNRNSLADEYSLCVRERKPLYHQISQYYDDLSRVYLRSLLPAEDAEGKVSRLFMAMRVLELPNIGNERMTSSLQAQ